MSTLFDPTATSNLFPILYDDGFTRANFPQSLSLISNEVALPPNLLISNKYGAVLKQDFLDQNYTDADFKQFFDNYISSVVNFGGGFSNKSMSDIIQGWYTYATDTLGLTLRYNDVMVNSAHSALYQSFLEQFLYTTNNGVDSQNQFVSGDWAVIFNSTQVTGLSGDFSSMGNNANPLVQAFNKFLSANPQLLQMGSGAGITLRFGESFFKLFEGYITGASVIQDPRSPITSNFPNDLNTYINLPSYQAIYKAYFTNATDAQFVQDLINFVKDQIQQNGYFLPSHALGPWLQTVIQKAQDIIPILKGGSLDGNSSEKALIIDRILRLLIKIVSSLQNVGIMQANRLKYLSQFQQAYTTLQTQIPTFLRGGPVLGGPDSASDRNDLNSSFHGILADNLRALRGIQEDNAKALQANINQTNDAVNQQTDMATSFLQELSTLLSTILR